MRGDGPFDDWLENNRGLFSPRAWGWSETARHAARRDGVLPTCVGMVRQEAAQKVWAERSPHVRGDGPSTLAHIIAKYMFSPRAWGWSEWGNVHLSRRSVLPTCVGMVRNSLCSFPGRIRSPHVRGDGPWATRLPRVRAWFSPRAWGWSVLRRWWLFTLLVLPTCVGMVRALFAGMNGRRCSPHVRGDGPRTEVRPRKRSRFSPRAWGWSAHGVLPVSPHADHYREAA